jgi:hypothetical protein
MLRKVLGMAACARDVYGDAMRGCTDITTGVTPYEKGDALSNSRCVIKYGSST